MLLEPRVLAFHSETKNERQVRVPLYTVLFSFTHRAVVVCGIWLIFFPDFCVFLTVRNSSPQSGALAGPASTKSQFGGFVKSTREPYIELFNAGLDLVIQ